MIGSIWNKWDLHIHSPLSHQNNQFNTTSIDSFIDKLIEKEISQIGVTNYFYFFKDELEIIRKKIIEKGANINVLGNIEFRISQQNKDGEWINIHCIFSEHLSTSKINNTLATFPVNNTTEDSLNIYCTQDSINSSSIQLSEVTVDFKKLLSHLSKSMIFGVDYLIAVCPNGYGGFRSNNKQGRSKATALEIEKSGQIILGRSQDRNYFLDNKRYENAIEKPVFVCSDAHSLEGFGSEENYSYGVGENFTWVKALPSFEGLRQALIEPEDRVQQT
ncbi:MAG: DNA repair protein, partial [Magnetococcales bacterium]|nr:DNA repair protein [Magnetococcales bacterium]